MEEALNDGWGDARQTRSNSEYRAHYSRQRPGMTQRKSWNNWSSWIQSHRAERTKPWGELCLNRRNKIFPTWGRVGWLGSPDGGRRASAAVGGCEVVREDFGPYYCTSQVTQQWKAYMTCVGTLTPGITEAGCDGAAWIRECAYCRGP